MNKHEEMVMNTRKNILNSFIELWKEKGLENITIGALTKELISIEEHFINTLMIYMFNESFRR